MRGSRSISTPTEPDRPDSEFGQSVVIDVCELVRRNKEKWVNFSLSEVNDCIVRLGIFEGEFHWHKHNSEDELFFVLEGKLCLDPEKLGDWNRLRAENGILLISSGRRKI